MTEAPQPSIRLALGKRVLAVELYDIARSLALASYHRDRSRCSFSDEIAHAGFVIGLRLDWGDLDADGEPTLDMDAWRVRDDGSRVRVRPRKEWHHTSLSKVASVDETRTYDVEFHGLSLRLVARKTFAASVGLSLYVHDPAGTPEPP